MFEQSFSDTKDSYRDPDPVLFSLSPFESHKSVLSDHSNTTTAESYLPALRLDEQMEKQQAAPVDSKKINGSLYWQIHNGISEIKVVDGQLKSKTGKTIGTIDDTGSVSIIEGKKPIQFKISTSEGSAFCGTDAQGRSLQLRAHKEGEGLNGVLTSPNGKETIEIKDGQLFDKNKTALGFVSKGGEVCIAKNYPASDELGSIYRNWTFEGSENGKARVFSLDKDTANGKLFLLDEKSGKPIQYVVRMGMVIQKDTGAQLGIVIPPTEGPDGKLYGGSITRFDTRQVVSLESQAGASFDLSVRGSTIQKRSVKGLCQGTSVNSGVNSGDGILNLRTAGDALASEESKAAKEIEETVRVKLPMVIPVGGRAAGEELLREPKARKEKAHQDHETMNKWLANGFDATDQKNFSAIKDISDVFSDARKIAEKSEQKSEKEKAQQQKENEAAAQRKIEVPQLRTEADVQSVNGKLRIGSQTYSIEQGKFFEIRCENGKETKESQSAGLLKPGYVAEIAGTGSINLAEEDRVFMEFTKGADGTKHRVISLGTSGMTSASQWNEGGLIDTEELIRRAEEARKAAGQGNSKYFEERPYLTGGLTNWLMGDREKFLKDFEKRLGTRIDWMKKEMDALFTAGFNTETTANRKVDGLITATDYLRQTIGSLSDSCQDLAEDARVNQKIVCDMATLLATSAVPWGIGAAYKNLEFLASLSRAASMTSRIGATGLATGAAWGAIRSSDKSTFLQNAEAGFGYGAAGAAVNALFQKVGSITKIGECRQLTPRVLAGESLTAKEAALASSLMFKMASQGSTNTRAIAAYLSAWTAIQAGKAAVGAWSDAVREGDQCKLNGDRILSKMGVSAGQQVVGMIPVASRFKSLLPTLAKALSDE